MTTTTLTPIWDMPKPGMLPSGLPLPQEPEESIGYTVVHRNGQLVHPGARIEKQGGLTRFLVEPVGDEHLAGLDALFKSALGEYALVSQPNPVAAALRLVSRERVVRDVERLRSSLFLTADETAAIAGLGARRYYELVGGKPFAEARLVEISNRVSIVNALAARDWQTAVTIVRYRAAETIEFLDGARLRDLQELFARTQNERLAVLTAGSTFDLADLAAQHAHDLTGILDAPAFDIAAKMVQWIGRADNQVKDRGKALVEVLMVFKALEDDDQVGERWDFLYGLTADKRAAFKGKADAFIRSDAFTRDRWEAFVATESERAWATATDVRLEPLEVSIETYPEESQAPAAWLPDMAQISAGFRPYDRRR
jgi:hypothetical protein